MAPGTWKLEMARILIVGDSAFARNSLRLLVENGGHEVVGCAADGDQALKLFKSLQPELVTLEYLMTDKNGDVVLDEIIRHDPNAKVIMISGSGDHTIEQKVLTTGAMIFLEKPQVRRDILNVIDQVMEI